jgi:hypothetical protein
MIELKDSAQLEKAIARAKASDLLVQPSGLFRQYHVTNRATGARYTVDFFVRRDGKRFGACTCKAGQHDIACKHLAAAAGLHVCRAAERKAEAAPVLMRRAAPVTTFNGIRL